MRDLEKTTSLNLQGSRNVFEAAIAAGTKRLVYALSAAAYRFRADGPELLTEELQTRGSLRHYYSAQKAELEHALWNLLEGSPTTLTCSDPARRRRRRAGADPGHPLRADSDRMPPALLRALERMPG